ncbi:MAG: hypothetical protein AB7O97_04480 [Planctomycetota bacterium]
MLNSLGQVAPDTNNLGVNVWNQQLHRLQVYEDLAVFPRGGDALTIELPAEPPPPETPRYTYVCWWSGQEHDSIWGNRIQGLRVDEVQGTIDRWWSTVAPLSAAQIGQPNLPWSAIGAHDLRAYHFQPHAERHAQALRLFEDPAAPGVVRCAAFTPGARLIVLEPGTSATDTGPAPIEVDTAGDLLDLGTGGMALAIGPARGDERTIYCGAAQAFPPDTAFAAGSATPDDIVSELFALRFTGDASLSNCTVARQSRILLDGSTSPFARPKVFAVCGMAVGELVASSPGPELVVGSLDGHLMVWALDQSSGDILPQAPLYETRVEGAVGAYNSFVIADLDPEAAGNELYAAGSLGLRKWIQ